MGARGTVGRETLISRAVDVTCTWDRVQSIDNRLELSEHHLDFWICIIALLVTVGLEPLTAGAVDVPWTWDRFQSIGNRLDLSEHK